MPNTGPTVRSLDERIDDLEHSVHEEISGLKLAIQEQGRQSDQKLNDFQKELAHFRGSVETSLRLATWIGAFAAAVICTLIGFGWQFSAANGRLEQKVSGLDDRMNKLEHQVSGLDDRMNKLEQQVGKVDERVAGMQKGIEEVKTLLLDLRKKLPEESK